MNLKDLLEVVNYQYESGGKYQWNCYGDDAYFIDFKTVSGKAIGGAVVDTAGEIYEAHVEVPNEPLCYRIVSPDYFPDYVAEAKSRNVDPYQAWDDVRYTNLETEEDFLEKFDAIVHERPFDRTIEIPLHLSEKDQLVLFRMAHESGMTFNAFMVQVLEDAVKKAKKKAKK